MQEIKNIRYSSNIMKNNVFTGKTGITVTVDSGASPRGGLGWTCPPPLLPETIPEIDADPASFLGGGGSQRTRTAAAWL